MHFWTTPKFFRPLYDRQAPPSCPSNVPSLDVLSPAEHAGAIYFRDTTHLGTVLVEKPILAKMGFPLTLFSARNRPHGKFASVSFREWPSRDAGRRNDTRHAILWPKVA